MLYCGDVDVCIMNASLNSAGFTVWGMIIENWVVVIFNGLFGIVSLYHINRLNRERRHIELSPQQAAVRDELFPGLSNRQFLIFWHLGSDERLEGEILTEGASVDHLLVLLLGEVEVRRLGETVATLHPHCFLGEMSFLGRERATATVLAAHPVLVRSWDQEKLAVIDAADPALHHALLSGMASDLVAKLAD